jgi:hypothetical protein
MGKKKKPVEVVTFPSCTDQKSTILFAGITNLGIASLDDYKGLTMEKLEEMLSKLCESYRIDWPLPIPLNEAACKKLDEAIKNAVYKTLNDGEDKKNNDKGP